MHRLVAAWTLRCAAVQLELDGELYSRHPPVLDDHRHHACAGDVCARSMVGLVGEDSEASLDLLLDAYLGRCVSIDKSLQALRMTHSFVRRTSWSMPPDMLSSMARKEFMVVVLRHGSRGGRIVRFISVADHRRGRHEACTATPRRSHHRDISNDLALDLHGLDHRTTARSRTEVVLRVRASHCFGRKRRGRSTDQVSSSIRLAVLAARSLRPGCI